METYQTLILETENSILTVTINAPERLNALSVLTIEELQNALEEVRNNNEIKGVIITGAGDKAFAAGADIEEISKLDEFSARKFAERGQQVFNEIEECEKPVVAAVNGYALGGGCELAMACHFRTASDNARFGQPEVNLGLIPGYGGTQRLTRLVGRGRALELMLTGNQISAEQALDFGLVNYVFGSNELKVRTYDILRKIISKGPIALSMVIDSVNSVNNSGQNGYETEANNFSICCKSKDFREGTTAFLEKRKPNFTGN